MARPRFHPLTAAALVLTLLVGAAAVAYGRWSRPLRDGEAAAAEGRREEAIAAYRLAEERFGRWPLTRFLFAREHAVAVTNQLALLYRAGDFDGVVDKAAASPSGASPHFWAGLSLMQLGMAAGREDAQLVWFSRAEEELKLALQADPGDWDTKVNYEIAARVVAEMRKQPKRRIENPLQLLRPQPAPGTPQRKVG
jgi:hypothetical protein